MGKAARVHLSVIVALSLFLLSFHYRLETYDLLFSERGIVYGASYTDIKAQLPVLRLLIVISILAGMLVALSQAVPDGVFSQLKLHSASSRMGRILKRLRFRPRRETSSGRERGWWLEIDAVRDVARAYGVPMKV